VLRSGNPLSVELGPGRFQFNMRATCLIFLKPIGILQNIFDGIQRPLETIAHLSGSVFVPRGVDVPSLDQQKGWDFTPKAGLKIGDLLTGGDVVGSTFENDLFNEHRILVPPKLYGRVIEIMPKGQYTVNQAVVVIEFEGK
jgi:vacuolar-type H+-ATPase catalytic subunit A/Vma1